MLPLLLQTARLQGTLFTKWNHSSVQLKRHLTCVHENITPILPQSEDPEPIGFPIHWTIVEQGIERKGSFSVKPEEVDIPGARLSQELVVHTIRADVNMAVRELFVTRIPFQYQGVL